MFRRSLNPLRILVARTALAAVAVGAGLEWTLAILRPEGGPLGVLQILAPHIAIVGVGLIPIALLERRVAVVIASVALVSVTALRFGGEWVSLPTASASSDATRISVATWNLEVFSRSGAETVALLRAESADLVALQELQPATSAAIEQDPVLAARYPYRLLLPRDDVVGMGLLSRFPLRSPAIDLSPAIQEATLELDGGPVRIINAHPFHAEISTLGGSRIPVGLDVTERNADLETLRQRIAARAADGTAVILLGDLNTASSEPAFDRLVAGLRDVHAEIGQGPGWTWRPGRLEFLGIGVLRIDHVVVTPDVAALAIHEACPAVGDHCLVHADLAVASPP